MKIYLRRKGDTLTPLTQEDLDSLKRIKDEQIIYVDYKKPRNPHFHAKFMSLVRTVFDNQDEYEEIEGVLNVIKVKTGHCTKLPIVDKSMPPGYNEIGEIYVPKSISFSSMDELKFDHFYHRAVAVCLTIFLPETSAQELEQAINERASYAG